MPSPALFRARTRPPQVLSCCFIISGPRLSNGVSDQLVWAQPSLHQRNPQVPGSEAAHLRPPLPAARCPGTGATSPHGLGPMLTHRGARCSKTLPGTSQVLRASQGTGARACWLQGRNLGSNSLRPHGNGLVSGTDGRSRNDTVASFKLQSANLVSST